MKAKIHFKRGQWRYKTCKGEAYSPYFIIRGKWETLCKPNKRTNPRGFVICQHTQIKAHEWLPDASTIRGKPKLCYDLEKRSFNATSGDNGIVFTPYGAFIL